MTAEYTTDEQLRAQMMAEEIKRLRGLGPITVHVDPYDAFVLVAYLQLAWRHPGLDERQKRIVGQFGRSLQTAFDSYDVPHLALTLEQGWDRAHDR